MWCMGICVQNNIMQKVAFSHCRYTFSDDLLMLYSGNEDSRVSSPFCCRSLKTKLDKLFQIEMEKANRKTYQPVNFAFIDTVQLSYLVVNILGLSCDF